MTVTFYLKYKVKKKKKHGLSLCNMTKTTIDFDMGTTLFDLSPSNSNKKNKCFELRIYIIASGMQGLDY